MARPKLFVDTSYFDGHAERDQQRSVSHPFEGYRFGRGFTYQGFEELGLRSGPDQVGEGPGEPPYGFVGGTTSRSEWFLFWAFQKILGPPGQGPREYTWEYQQSFQGGRHIPGGSVVDFVVYTPLYTVLCRLVSYYYHHAAGSEKQASDFEQRVRLGESSDNSLVVIDVYEEDFIHDETGEAAIEVAKLAIAGVEMPNPIATGSVMDNG